MASQPYGAVALTLVLGLTSCAISADDVSSNARPSDGPSGAKSTIAAIHPASFHLPSARQREVVVDTDSGLLLAGGLNATGQSLRSVEVLDPATGGLTPLGSLAVAVHDAAGVMIDGRLIVFGGGSSTSLDTVQSFDPATGVSAVIGHLPGPRSDLAAAKVGATVYLFGGYDDSIPRRDVLATTDGVQFRKVAALPAGVRYPGVTIFGPKIIVVGGQTASGASASVFEFDPASGRLRRLGTLPEPVGHAAVFTLGGAIYVVGGLTAKGMAATTVSRVDPSTGAVTLSAPLRRPVTDAGVGVHNARAFIIGGAIESDVATTVASILVASLRRSGGAASTP